MVAGMDRVQIELESIECRSQCGMRKNEEKKDEGRANADSREE